MAEEVGFFLHWTIEKFSYWDKNILMSPSFTVCMLEDTSWNLYLKESSDKIVCVLRRNDKGQNNINLCYEISILDSDGTLKRKYASRVPCEFPKKTFGTEIILMSCKEYKEKFIDLLKKDALIVCCRMRIAETIGTVQYFIRTLVNFHTRCLKWVMEDLYPRKQATYLLKYTENDFSPYKLNLLWDTEDFFGLLLIYIVQIEPFRRQHVKCKISVLDTEGEIIVCKCSESYFSAGRELWLFPPFVNLGRPFENKDLYLPGGKVCLLVEMQMSGSGIPGLDQINFNKVGTFGPYERKHATSQSIDNPLMTKLLDIYKDKKFCDVVLKTDTASFPVHKVFLCAQSSVFTAMLESELKEKATGIIPIPNMSDHTVRRMILFMYTDQVEVLNFEVASNLYFASDQYDIVPLKLLCRNFLKSNLDVSNITDALVIADVHEDGELKAASYDFILEHDREVIDSNKWVLFMQDHMKLAAETMHLIYCRKLEK